MLVACDRGVMIDIGGASTEFALFDGGKPTKLASLPIGCLSLALAHVREIVPTAGEMGRIKAEIDRRISKTDWGEDAKRPQMIGVGGTLRAALKLSRAIFGLAPDQNDIEASHVKKLARLLRDGEDKVYQAVYRAVPERVMTISPGLAILRQAIKNFGCETISVSRYGVREGYLTDRMLKADGGHHIHRKRKEG
ncbi:MAG: hypothetical protein LBS32_03845 [Clostridiales Family XIII bacterium]|jgi:exopolyphosphatase/guanosine-5'-triphosphate,3'-diphosphate pyrophosphatase|nr:hypothetical protein [Clostridiales Family XIII bacterium]